MADTTENQTPVVDETPISSVQNPARKNSLSTYLKNRPERSELVESMSRDSQPSICPFIAEMLALGLHCLIAVEYDIAPGRHLILTRFTENILPDSSAAPGLIASQKEVRIRSLIVWPCFWSQDHIGKTGPKVLTIPAINSSRSTCLETSSTTRSHTVLLPTPFSRKVSYTTIPALPRKSTRRPLNWNTPSVRVVRKLSRTSYSDQVLDTMRLNLVQTYKATIFWRDSLRN